MLDAVHVGLNECLNLVHADMRQMTEHRNKLAVIEQKQIQAKLVPPDELLETRCSYGSGKKEHSNQSKRLVPMHNDINKNSISDVNENSIQQDDDNEEDPHHLAGLKLLDKRLADSFSRALSLNDLRKTSMAVKNQNIKNRTSIFQVLLGKSSKASKLTDDKFRSEKTIKIAGSTTPDKFDNRAIIDDINKQTRLAMQYSKQLEAHLLKVEDLKARYEMHLKMDLSRSNLNLTASRLSLKSNRSKGGSQSGKSSIKEFIENIDRIESEFETYMGSFLLAIEDIQGFARVCQGDVFEISIKYGDAQKFVTRITILKDNRQKCDNRQIVFKAHIADVLAIKAHECKGLGKRVLLGHKLCETRDLFTARSQLMTISLNQTGSIKLNMIITWNPLHMAPNPMTTARGLDISHISLPHTPASSSTLSSLSSVPSTKGGVTTTTIDIQSPSRMKLNHSPASGVEDRYRHPRVHDTAYQPIDPLYGYYIPPPDYVTNEVNCCNN